MLKNHLGGDEIDLLKLISNLWHQKYLIILVTLCITATGGFYAFLSTPVYESKIYLIPPREKDVVELKKLAFYSGTSVDYSISYVYNRFNEVLNSNQAKSVFFQQKDILNYYMDGSSSEKGAWENFLENLTINSSNPLQNINVSLETTSAQYSKKWLNSYIAQVILLTKEQLFSDIREAISSKRERIDIKISSRLNLYSSNLEKEIVELNEALVIANALNLISPLNKDIVETENSNLMIDKVRRLYKLGSKVLKVEIETLKNRNDNSLFIPGLSRLLQQQNVLSSLTINKVKIQPVQIDLEALVSDNPIKPKKIIILAVSIILGLLFGIISALVHSLIRNRSEFMVSPREHS